MNRPPGDADGVSPPPLSPRQPLPLLPLPLLPLKLPGLEAPGVALALADIGSPDEDAWRTLRDAWLTAAERAEHATRGVPARRREWLAGRVLVKQLAIGHQLAASPQDCELRVDAKGRPRLALSEAGAWRDDGRHDCSISHKNTTAGPVALACLAPEPGQRLGVDIEEVSPRLVKLRAMFEGPEDRLLGEPSPEQRLTTLWALKEAAAKVIGLGVGVGLTTVACQETAPGEHRIVIGDREMTARTADWRGCVVVLASAPSDRLL
ncbi:4'-phosphopantetheinyl transferase [Pseudobythopirellula maris]|uniref:4'-phosphopantetheinyl transferase n=1 Tax=Pseudobythopirellula maris TaxID=2527991 RepID=A0A5C5ZLN9_9BACT|nr:4'-phosphopantetheinyl transferase superfamily protein [Pseudobythopirellula maris]TWT87363.1 4'-phosphopantetheinyl transferase [Pseudobythopirellula maris]